MNALYELIELIPENSELPISERLQELFVFLQKNGKIKSEQEAKNRFLGKGGDKKYFNKLKNRLKQKLADYIIRNPHLWLGVPYHKKFEECYKNFMIYRLLLRKAKRAVAIDIAKKLVLKLEELELHSLLYTVATDLRFHYSSVAFSASQFKKYDAIVKEQIAILKAESIVRTYHSRMCFIQNAKESFTPALADELVEAVATTLPYLALDSHYLNRFIYNIVIWRYMAEFDYQLANKYCEEALQSIPSTHPNINALRFNYLQMQIPPLIAIGAVKRAKANAKEACQMMPKGKFNWHLAFIHRVLVCLHTGAYQEAYDLYKAHEKHSCKFPKLGEYWKIMWGYLYFLIKAGKIKEYSEERFHLGKFLNEVPHYSKDKAGNNLNILIIQILTRIQREQYGQLIDRVDAIRAYVRTYTRNRETIRANTFIKMILKMSVASFHRKGTERKTQKLLQQLRDTPLYLGQNLGVEIVPYEVLWEELLGMLDNKFRTSIGKRTNPANTKNNKDNF